MGLGPQEAGLRVVAESRVGESLTPSTNGDG